MNDRSRLIAVYELPMPISQMSSLASLHPKGSTVRQVGAYLWVRSPGELCWGCITCTNQDAEDFQRLTDGWTSRGFIVCPSCGNKRCPRATHHDNPCSGSNDPGQTGSVYA